MKRSHHVIYHLILILNSENRLHGVIYALNCFALSVFDIDMICSSSTCPYSDDMVFLRFCGDSNDDLHGVIYALIPIH